MVKPEHSVRESHQDGGDDQDPLRMKPVDFIRVNQNERFDIWDEFLTKKISHHIRNPSSKESFEGELTTQSIGLLRRFNIDSSPYTSRVTNEVLSSRTHNESYILIVPKRGEFYLNQDGHNAHLRVGDMALLDSRLTGSISGLGHCAQTMIVVGRKKWEEHFTSPVLDSNFKIEDNGVMTRLIRAFLTELEQNSSDIREQDADLISKQFLEILAAYFEGYSGATSDTLNKRVRLQKIKSYVRQHIKDPNLGPIAISNHFNISTRYVSRLFEESGNTLMDYIWHLRLQRAVDLLTNMDDGHASLKEIAHSLGFRSQSHFSTRFSERFGSSPSEYRSSYRIRND